MIDTNSTVTDLSVIIPTYNARATIGNCLTSLQEQATAASYEIIVVDSSSDGTADLVEEAFPATRVLRFAERKFPGDARNHGIAMARGAIIAFIDADCTVAPDWAERVLAAHNAPEPAIGGAIANGNPDSLVGWGAYFCEFSQWLPGGRGRQLDDIACASMSYKKEIFAHLGSFIEGTYCSDTEFHWRLGKAGHHLLFAPSIVIRHHNIDRAGKYLRHEFHHGRSFATVRVRSQGMSWPRRWTYVLLSPLIAIKLFAATGLRVLANREYARHFLKSVPLLTLGIISWSLGECSGYATTKYQP